MYNYITSLYISRHVLVFILLLFCDFLSIAQSAQQLVKIHNVANISAMNSISSPSEGSLVYVNTENCLYQYNGTGWTKFWKSNGNQASQNDFIGTTNNQDLRISTNNSQRMVIKSDGKIGINMEDPDFLFQVNSELAGGESSDVSITNTTASTNSGSNATNINDGNSGSFWQSATSYQSGGSYSNWIKLDLGTPKVVVRYQLQTPSANPTDWHFQGSNNNINWVNLHSINELSGSTWTFRDYTLSSQTTAYRYYRLFMTSTLWTSNSNGSYSNIGFMRIGEFRLFESTELGGDFIIDSNGNVGIGILPEEKLHINGNILATGTITPDYVFQKYYNGKSKLKPKYQFKSLEKTERFIKKNKHLPGVPSAKKIKEQGGIIVNRATEINLEKIEELYLHIFELNDRIKKLEKELNIQKKSERNSSSKN